MKRFHALLLLALALSFSGCEQTDETIPQDNFLVVDGYQHDYGTQPGETLSMTENTDGSTTFQWTANQAVIDNKRTWEVTLPAGANLRQDQTYTLGTQAVPVSESGLRLASVRVLDINTPEACSFPVSLNGELSMRYFERGSGNTILFQFDDIQFIRICDNEEQEWGNLSGQMVYIQQN